MALRCLLFTSEAGTAEPICRALSALGVEGEHCPEPVGAVDKVSQQTFQIVIVDWDQQPEASMVLAAARERKANERPLTLAIVNEDIDVPKALQAGANSILRRPILINQVKDTLTTARDLLKAKGSASMQAAAGPSGNSAPNHSTSPTTVDAGNKKNLRGGEFLLLSGPRPSGEFVVEESHVPEFAQPVHDIIDPLKELEPMAASVVQARPEATPPPQPAAQILSPDAPSAPGDEPHGLDWYMKRAGLGPSAAAPAPAPIPMQTAPAKPELLGFDQTANQSAPATSNSEKSALTPEQQTEHEKRAEVKLFAYIEGESNGAEREAKPRIQLTNGPIIAAFALAACAIIVAPQAPWHASVSAALAHGQRSFHAWLNPQPVTTPQAPESHESFGRAGDEYKLPVAESIPDATTDPSQIRVVPVVDPTAKKPNSGSANPDQGIQSPDGTGQGTDTASQGTGPHSPADQSVATTPESAQPPSGSTSPAALQPSTSQPPVSANTPATSAPTNPSTAPTETHSNPPAVPPSLLSPRPADPAGPRVQVPQAGPNATVAGPSNVPSSLKSQIASMTPEASGNKAPEAALPSIEPVVVSEAAERQLATDQPAIAYPASAKGQHGTVILQLLIGRDGIVQDAKFLQGSLAFARAAIDGVRQWKFKPYLMNGRPVSVQTTMTMSFKPSS